ncbi:glycosyltransferase [Sporosarcina sp. FSL K6-1540]|uniref:glycosyltransferase n=1 Tax=Sporosarcina sp. FSL K6-1540 TaxID=2921555 RepID=UPI00315A9EAC
MKIMVFDVPAESGGALSILEEFYQEVKKHHDKSIQWTFVLSKPMLQESKNIKILRFPWIKKSWLHRIYFDQITAPNIVKKYKPDKIFSLQNITVPRVDVEQIIYVHQSLPFVDYQFDFKENKLFWIYQNVLSKAIYKSIKKSTKVIVQTNWFKDACVEKTGVSENKIIVISPKININIKKCFLASEKSLSTFFYPAGASYYKNHRTIVEACKKMKGNKDDEYRVIFTLKGDENDHVSNLYQEVQNNQLPIEFIGSISREEVFNYYSKSVLIFPSYIETFGLPMLESKLHKGMILTANTPLSHEILDGHLNTYFFDTFNSEELAQLMKQVSNGEISYIENNSFKYNNEGDDRILVNEVVD